MRTGGSYRPDLPLSRRWIGGWGSGRTTHFKQVRRAGDALPPPRARRQHTGAGAEISDPKRSRVRLAGEPVGNPNQALRQQADIETQFRCPQIDQQCRELLPIESSSATWRLRWLKRLLPLP